MYMYKKERFYMVSEINFDPKSNGFQYLSGNPNSSDTGSPSVFGRGSKSAGVSPVITDTEAAEIHEITPFGRMATAPGTTGNQNIDSKIENHPNIRIKKGVNYKDLTPNTKQALYLAGECAKSKGYKIQVNEGARTPEYQRSLAKRLGKGIADSENHSMHVKKKAFDLILLDASGRKITDVNIYVGLAKNLRSKGYDIYNGREFPDAPKDNKWKEAWHFQLGRNDGRLFGW